MDMHSDVHLDVLRLRWKGETRVLERRHLPKWRDGGLNVVVLNTIPKFGPEPYPYRTSPLQNALLTFDALFEDIAESGDHFSIVLEPGDIHISHRDGKIGLILGIEGAEATESDLGLLRTFHRLGLRVMNITWHHRNLASDGVSEPSNSGLSNFGKELIAELNRLGIIIDVSHLSPQGISDVLGASRTPVLASHSNAKAVYPHQRNLDDEQIRSICEAGGLIGVVFLGRFVAEKNPSIQSVLRHIDHISKIAGTRHVGFGADYTDYVQDMIIGARRTAGLLAEAMEETIPYAQGLEHAGLLGNLTKALIRGGYSQRQTQDILGNNFLRLFQQVRALAG